MSILLYIYQYLYGASSAGYTTIKAERGNERQSYLKLVLFSKMEYASEKNNLKSFYPMTYICLEATPLTA